MKEVGEKTLVEAMCDHLLSGVALTPQEIRSWLDALDAFKGPHKPMRMRLDNFASAVGLDKPKRGRPPEKKTYRQIAKRAEAVRKVWALRSEGLSREKAILQVAEDFLGDVDKSAVLEKWISNERIKDTIKHHNEVVAPFVKAMLEQHEWEQARIARK